MSVLVIAAIAASAILTLFVTSLNSILNSGDAGSARISRALADACVELSLQSVTNGSALAPQTINEFTTGTCAIVAITNASGNDWTIQTSGTATNSNITKYIETLAEKPGGTGAMVVQYWKECFGFPC